MESCYYQNLLTLVIIRAGTSGRLVYFIDIFLNLNLELLVVVTSVVIVAIALL